jgi:hypothetical protein
MSCPGLFHHSSGWLGVWLEDANARIGAVHGRPARALARSAIGVGHDACILAGLSEEVDRAVEVAVIDKEWRDSSLGEAGTCLICQADLAIELVRR